MDCPVCKNAMITMELDEVEVDHCLDCGGIWLDSGELEMLLDGSNEAKNLLDSFTAAKKCREKKRKCPICMKKMEKIMAGAAESAILLDKCRKGHGLWFDSGELQDIVKSGSFDKENKVNQLLNDMFGEKI
jgi:Zn-finger nucleic acid-binding protein